MILRKLALNDFRPIPVCRSGWAQTVAATYIPRHLRTQKLPEVFIPISLSDGDKLIAVESKPLEWREGDPIVVLVHGLSGSYRSNYMVRLTHKLLQHNFLVVRVNLRGCGPGRGMASKPYHSGRSEDTRQMLEFLAARHPHSPVTQVGFSLGGNLTLKMAGEDGPKPSGNLDSVIAVSPPVDLVSCSARIRENGWFFDHYFVLRLKKMIAHFDWDLDWKEIEENILGRKIRLADIDELFVAPKCGFKNAFDYYEKSSSLPILNNIMVKTLILCAKDDPVIDFRPLADQVMPEHINVILTENGGHVGFLGQVENVKSIRWMDELLLRWIKAYRSNIL